MLPIQFRVTLYAIRRLMRTQCEINLHHRLFRRLPVSQPGRAGRFSPTGAQQAGGRGTTKIPGQNGEHLYVRAFCKSRSSNWKMAIPLSHRNCLLRQPPNQSKRLNGRTAGQVKRGGVLSRFFFLLSARHRLPSVQNAFNILEDNVAGGHYQQRHYRRKHDTERQ